MRTCTVCGQPARELVDSGGTSRGNACSTECAAMVYFRWGSSPDRRAFEAWEWRRRWHTVRDLPFDEPSPPGAGERAWMAMLAANPKLKELDR